MINYSVLNAHHSASRNMYLISSIALVVMGLASTFPNAMRASIIKYVSITMFVYAGAIGVFSVYGFNKFIAQNIDETPEYAEWYGWSTLSIVYLVILSVIMSMLLLRGKK